MSSSAKRHLTIWIATLALSGGLFLPGASLFRWDTLVYNWPMLMETRAQWLAGHFPFWASSFCNGTPLLENVNAGVLYPLRLLLWLLPLRLGYSLFLTLHIALSLYGMEALLRRGMRMPGWGPLLGAFTYAASGYARGMWDTHNFVALPWLPLGLAALLEARRSGGFLRATLGVALSWALLLFSGDLQAAALWVPIAALLAVYSRSRGRLLAALFCGLAIAVPSTALQWLPTLSASHESYRAGGLDMAEAVERSFHPLRLLEMILPYGLGNRDAWAGAQLMGAGAVRVTPWTSSAGLGVLSLALFPLAIRPARRRRILVWAWILLTGGLLLAMGRFLPGYTIWQSLPIISSFRYPEKYLLWSTLGGAFLTGYGFARLQAWGRLRRAASQRARYIRTAFAILAFAALLCGIILHQLVPVPARLLAFPLGTVLAVCLLLLGVARGRQTALLAAGCIGLLLPWYAEKPLTWHFDPLAKPATLAALPHPAQVAGRVWADPAIAAVPLPPSWGGWRPTEKQSEFYRESWTFNMPRIWGYATAGGFSPAESGAMGALRRGFNATNVTAKSMANYCRLAAVEWLLTTPARLAELQAEDLPVTHAAGWGEPEAVIIAHVESARWADLDAGTNRISEVLRPHPGVLRVDLKPGRAGVLRVAESFALGWSATDQGGRKLEIMPAADAFIGVRIMDDTRQVRLCYRPVRWTSAVAVSLTGSLLFLVALFVLKRKDLLRLARGPALPAVIAAIAAVALGLWHRADVSCTFDEGFHVARGLAWKMMDDSRMSYFHPPLQNALCGYFADLAVGERVDAATDGPGWKTAEVQAYAIDLVARNRDSFPELLQAARCGSALLLALLCAVGVAGAFRFGGPHAAWLCAAGLVLQPSLLAHGHLATTDIGVAAFALAGTVTLAIAVRKDGCGMGWPLLCFILAAVTKHSGLIWLAAFLLGVVPVLAWRHRRPALLAWIPVGLVGLVCALLLLYGAAPQEIRSGWATSLPAGRFIEGLVRQSDHALSGHRAFLAGQLFTEGAWWHAPLTLLLKTPEVWSLAALAAALIGLARRPGWMLIALLPAALFAALLMFAGKLSLGVRHLLPLLALGVVGGSVLVARLSQPLFRSAATAVLLVGSMLAMLQGPDRIAYVASWAGGAAHGPEWVADSNFDWGQDAGRLEEHWAELTASAGRAPTLYYFGFLDPAFVYRLPVGPGSYLGFMGRGQDVAPVPPPGRVTVASVSATALNPHGLPLGAVTNGVALGDLGACYRMYQAR